MQGKCMYLFNHYLQTRAYLLTYYCKYMCLVWSNNYIAEIAYLLLKGFQEPCLRTSCDCPYCQYITLCSCFMSGRMGECSNSSMQGTGLQYSLQLKPFKKDQLYRKSTGFTMVWKEVNVIFVTKAAVSKSGKSASLLKSMEGGGHNIFQLVLPPPPNFNSLLAI